MHRQIGRTLAIVCLLAVTSQAGAGEHLPKGILKLDGENAPPLVLEDMDGNRWDIQQARGRWIFVHFWASWCGPCRKEMPAIQAIYPEFASSGLEIVLINTAESEDTVFAFLAAVAPDITPLMDNDGLVTERWAPRGLPSTYLVDPSGKLRYVALGGRPWDTPDYLNFLRRLLRPSNGS